jgi:hypothetical protein
VYMTVLSSVLVNLQESLVKKHMMLLSGSLAWEYMVV